MIDIAPSDLVELMEKAPHGVIVLTPEQCVVWANDAALKIFGYSKCELIGQKVETLIPEVYRERHGEWVGSFIGAHEIRLMSTRPEITAMRKDGTTVAVDISLTYLKRPGCVIPAAFIYERREATK